MANYNEHKCLTCGQIFDYCRRCAVTPVVYKAEGFCSEKCSHIFNALSKHSCNLVTAEETLAELSKYNLDEITLTEDILEHIDRIKSKDTVKEMVETEAIATVIEEVVEAPTSIVEDEPIVKSTAKQSNKNNKKKW